MCVYYISYYTYIPIIYLYSIYVYIQRMSARIAIRERVNVRIRVDLYISI